MRLRITHVTAYDYDQPVHYGLQRLRLTPKSGNGQAVIDWRSDIEGGERQLEFDDHFGNHTQLIKADAGARRIEIVSRGTVEVADQAGVVGPHRGFVPLWLYREPTPITSPGTNLRALARQIASEHGESDDLGLLHATSAMVLSAMRYETGRTDATTGAESALAAGHGVCQDHAHVMIALSRLLGFPARYVSGYLMMDGQVEQDASHAWCEVHIAALGWVGFDVSNGISPDTRYVRVATGRDYSGAAPIMGMRQGEGGERLHVALQVQQ